MLKRLNNFRKDELVRGSIILVIMLGIFNLLNYVFQISMAKMLGPAEYGILAALMSIVYIFGIPSEAIQTVIAKYTSKFKIKNENGKIKDLLLRSFRKVLKFSTILFILFVIVCIPLSNLLKINFYLLALTGLLIFSSFILPLTRGTLQGSKKFMDLGLNLIFESGFKIIFSITLVFLGLSVYGGMIGVIVGCVIAFFLSLLFIKEIFRSRRKNEDFENIFSYNVPSLIAITSIVLIYSLDIILARIFFSPELAGQYAFVSLIGKTILFVNLAIGKAMFPLTSEGFEKGRETKIMFRNSILLVSFISIIALVMYYFFPEFIITILSLGSKQYLAAASVLFILGLAYTFTSFSNVIILYKISTNKIKNSAYIFLFFVVIQLGIWQIYHSSILEFSIGLLVSNAILLLYSLYLIKK